MAQISLAALAACGGKDLQDADGDGIADGVRDPNNVTVVVPATPKGAIAGEVRDALELRPLAGVKVVLLGAGRTDEFTTTASGRFEFLDLPAGARYALRTELSGYAAATVTRLDLPDDAGNFPSDHNALFVGPIELLPLTGKLQVQVVSQSGEVVRGAQVTAESAIAWTNEGAAAGSVAVSATTDVAGLASLENLPDVWRLPPSRENVSGLVISVAPVDADADGRAELDGAVLSLTGRQVRTLSQPPLLVLTPPANEPLRLVASNVVDPAPGDVPPLLSTTDNLRFVFSRAVDSGSVLVDLRNEDGSEVLTTSVMPGAVANVLVVDPAMDFVAGRECDLWVRVRERDAVAAENLQVSAHFFAQEDPSQAISPSGRFVDDDVDGTWGTGTDEFLMTFSLPIGRARRSPAFRVELWVALDLNGSGTVGDGAGELPNAGGDYPSPQVVDAREPAAGNGVANSGFTRFLAPVRINLPVPINETNGAVNYEIRIVNDRNDNLPVTTPGGRRSPERFTASATLVR